MEDRKRKIAEAAIRVYSRQGVKRSTMSDIAAEAGVTRQTVYNAYPGTDAVLRAAISVYIDAQWRKIVDAWAQSEHLPDRLDSLFEHFALEPWEYVHGSTHTAELAGGYNAEGKAAVEEARLTFHGDIADLFEPHRKALQKRNVEPHDLAEFISAAIEGIKYNYHSRDDVLVAISVLKASLLALTQE